MSSVPGQSLVDLKELMGFCFRKLVWQQLREREQDTTEFNSLLTVYPLTWVIVGVCEALEGARMCEFLSRSTEKTFKDSLKKPYAGL